MDLTKEELNIINIALAQRAMTLQDAIVLAKAKGLKVNTMVAQYEATVRLHLKIVLKVTSSDA